MFPSAAKKTLDGGRVNARGANGWALHGHRSDEWFQC